MLRRTNVTLKRDWIPIRIGVVRQQISKLRLTIHGKKVVSWSGRLIDHVENHGRNSAKSQGIASSVVEAVCTDKALVGNIEWSRQRWAVDPSTVLRRTEVTLKKDWILVRIGVVLQ